MKNKLEFEDEELNQHSFFWKYPLTTMIIVSVIGLSVFSVVGGIKGNYKMKIKMNHPLFAAVLLDERENTVLDKVAEKTTESSKDLTATDATQEAATTESNEKIAYPTEFVDVEKTPEDSPYYNDPGKEALTTGYPYIKVDDSYFDDAVFIGDSRIEGLHDYSGLEKAAFYYKQGTTVYDMMTEPIATLDDGTVTTVPDALEKKHFNKVFIMVGINELGNKTTPEYAEKYKENIDTIRQLEPHAVIFIMGVMHVTKAYSDSSDVFNNVNINDKNVSVAGFANGIDTFYLDMNPAVTDESGGVVADYTWDGIHLKAEYYQLWVDFLKEHGLPNDMFPELEGVEATTETGTTEASTTEATGSTTEVAENLRQR